MYRILRIIIGLIFIAAGIGAMGDSGRFAEEFSRWGYSMSFLKFAGTLEIIFGILLLWRRTAFIGLLGVTAILVLGLVKHVTFGDPFKLMIPGIASLALVIAAYFFRN